VLRKVQLNQNCSKNHKFAPKTTKNPIFFMYPIAVFGNNEKFTFKCFNPYTKMPLIAKISKTTKRVKDTGGSSLLAGADVSMIL
jgi:hypothetical protein